MRYRGRGRGSRRERHSVFPQRFYKTRYYEYEEGDKSGSEAIDAERLDDEYLYKDEVERNKHSDKRDKLKCATDAAVKNSEFEGREQE